jgi:hypothetical protein
VQNADVASIARSPQSCSTHKVSLFLCLLGICANCWRCANQRFAHLLPSVSSAFVTGCRRWGQCGVKASKQAEASSAFAHMKSLRFKHEKGAGGTGIEPATCGFGALGALSSVVQPRLNCPRIRTFWRRIVQRRPRTSSRYVVSFVVSLTCTRAQGVGRSTNWNALISPGHFKQSAILISFGCNLGGHVTDPLILTAISALPKKTVWASPSCG